MFESLTTEEKIQVYNWFYKLGDPLVSDRIYNSLYERLRKETPQSELITKTWSEMPKPTEALRKSNLLTRANNLEEERQTQTNSKYFLPTKNMEIREQNLRRANSYFNRLIPKSIDTIETERDALEWLRTCGEVYYNISIKADGFHIKLVYVYGYFVQATTRGRIGEAEDVTNALSKIVPLFIEELSAIEFVQIKGEAVIFHEDFEFLKNFDKSRKWKSQRNSVRTLLIPNLSEEYYKRLTYLAFKIEGKDMPTLASEFELLKNMGFQVPANVTIPYKNYSDFINVVRKMSEVKLPYISDGCVVTVNDYKIYNSFDTAGKYDYAMRAFRMFGWESPYYVSLFKGVKHKYAAKRISIRLDIMPTKVFNGSTITNPDADNYFRIEDAGITKVGDIVVFRIRSGANAEWLARESYELNKMYKENPEEIPENILNQIEDLKLELKKEML